MMYRDSTPDTALEQPEIGALIILGASGLPDLWLENREVLRSRARGNNHLRLVSGTGPTSVNREVVPAGPQVLRSATPRRGINAHYRAREYLTEAEVEKMIKAAASVGRHPVRDAAAILVAYRHGLRVSELVALIWANVDLEGGLLHVQRAKRGKPSVHPLRGLEIRALRRLAREYPGSPYVFVTERMGPLSVDAVQVIIRRAGIAAGLGEAVHPHQLRHACGYALANKGQDTRAIQAYLGHASISHTVRYSELAPGRFSDFFKEV